jgi:hypothetical protein
MRRAGKTTYLHQVRRERLAAGLPRGSLPYVDFEDPLLDGFRPADFRFLVDAYRRMRPAAAEAARTTWVFDEIQVVPGWERFLRRLLGEGSPEILFSGSSAALLSGEIGTAMRGRCWDVVLHPFSFEERLRHLGREVPGHADALAPPERAALEREVHAYLRVGGFPEVQAAEDAVRARMLRDYVDVVVLRDVIDRHRLSHAAGLRALVRHLLGNPGGGFSVSRFHGALRSAGVAIAKDTVHEHLAHLEDAFLVRVLWMESDSERRRMVNPRKVYPVDPGLNAVFAPSGRAGLGHALETAVLLELERRWCRVTFVRTSTGHEVDFLARHPDGTRELIQVSVDASDPATADREIRALEEAGREHPGARRTLVTLTEDGFPPGVPPGVVVHAAAPWLLRDRGDAGRARARPHGA